MALNNYRTRYDKWWSQYDELNHLDPGTRIRKEFIIRYLSGNKIHTILDLGCGTGELLDYVHERFPKKKLYGADVSSKAIERVQSKGIAEKVYLIDLTKPSYLPGKYDAVVCSEVIEHLERTRYTFDLIASLCKKNGKAIITVPSGKIYPHHRKLGHYQHFEPENITVELNNRDFKVLVSRKLGYPFMNLKNILLTYVLQDRDYSHNQISLIHQFGLKIFYYLYKYSFKGAGPQLVVVAKKK